MTATKKKTIIGFLQAVFCLKQALLGEVESTMLKQKSQAIRLHIDTLV